MNMINCVLYNKFRTSIANAPYGVLSYVDILIRVVYLFINRIFEFAMIWTAFYSLSYPILVHILTCTTYLFFNASLEFEVHETRNICQNI